MSLLSETSRIETAAFEHPWTTADIRAFCEAGDFLLILISADPASQNAGGSAAPPQLASAGNLPELTAGTTQPSADGFLLARLQTDDGTAEVIRIAVKPESRGRGLAGRLLEELERRVTGRILLEVSERNQPAVGLYKSRGFQIIHRRPDYYPDGSAAWIMEKNCSGAEPRGV